MTLYRHQRQRKTKDPCLSCFLHKDLCLCPMIPRLDLSTRVSVLIHHRELKRTTNTGRLATLALSNSATFVRGLPHQSLDWQQILPSGYHHILLYPAEDAAILDETYVTNAPSPLLILVPDGNWRQASKVHTRHPELADIPRIKLPTQEPVSMGRMRVESKPDGMATLEAIAYALGMIEGKSVQEQLLQVYEQKCQRTLLARGIKSDQQI